MDDPHCEYCNCTNQNCLAQCTTTGLHFCNGKGATSQSHIIHFLRTMKCDQISFPSTSRWYGIPMKCYVCDSTNIFRLGLVQTIDKKHLYVACRSPCQFDETLQEKKVDNKTFSPIVMNNEINSGIIEKPMPEEYTKIPIARTLEVRDKALALLGDEAGIRINQSKLPPAKLQYDSVQQYIEIMTNFVDEEQHESEFQHRNTKFAGQVFEWISDIECTCKAQPLLYRMTSIGTTIRMAHGQDVEIGRVSRRFNNMNIDIRFANPSKFCNMDYGLIITPIVSDIPFTRQRDALQALNTSTPPMHWLLVDIFLGCTEKLANHNRIKNRTVKISHPNDPSFPMLNESQARAVNVALNQRFTMIQGPPGTGKTTVIASIVYSLVEAGIKPILVCAQSNVAVDFATTRIAQTGVDVVRVLSSARESVDNNVDQFTTKKRAEEAFGEEFIDLINSEDSADRKKATMKEREIIASCDVVCSTCTGTGGARLRGIKFPVVIFDEAGQCLDPDLLIPLVHQAEQTILVGDHRQLGPMVVSRETAKARYDLPLMQRLILLQVYPVILKVQYRMHPGISEFPSEVFYQKKITDGITAEERELKDDPIPWPNLDVPIIFWNINSKEENYDSALSYLNYIECQCASEIINMFYKSHMDPSEIGIITPYAGQQILISDALPQLCDFRDPEYTDQIEIASVDAFQGREKDYIIFSCTRANDTYDIGFLKDMRRLCVSLTRARYGLILLCNAKTFAKNKLWVKFIEHCITKGVFVQGKDLSYLEPSNFTSLVMPTEDIELEEIDDIDDDDNLIY